MVYSMFWCCFHGSVGELMGQLMVVWCCFCAPKLRTLVDKNCLENKCCQAESAGFSLCSFSASNSFPFFSPFLTHESPRSENINIPAGSKIKCSIVSLGPPMVGSCWVRPVWPFFPSPKSIGRPQNPWFGESRGLIFSKNWGKG